MCFYSRSATTVKILFPMLFALIFVSSCSPPEVEVSGQVFVVTRGAESVKLGLVEVRLLPEEDVLKHFEARKVEAQLEQGKMDSLIEQRGKELRIALADAKAAFKALDIACDQYSNGGGTSSYEKYKAIERSAIDKRKAIFDRLHVDSTLVARREHYFSSAEFYFIALPGGIASTKTDSDGNFRLKAPKRGSFILAASASREVVGHTEQYFWLVKLGSDAEANHRVLLSNDNMTTAASPNSILRTTQ